MPLTYRIRKREDDAWPWVVERSSAARPGDTVKTRWTAVTSCFPTFEQAREEYVFVADQRRKDSAVHVEYLIERAADWIDNNRPEAANTALRHALSNAVDWQIDGRQRQLLLNLWAEIEEDKS